MAQGTQVCHCEAPTGPWQSHAGSCDFADGFPVVRPCSARLPRRFAPRNDTSGAFTIITIGCSDRQHCAGAGCPLPYNGVCGRRQYAQICCCQRRSLTAATDAIGAYRFHGGLYKSAVPSRDCHVASLLAMTNLEALTAHIASLHGGHCPMDKSDIPGFARSDIFLSESDIKASRLL